MNTTKLASLLALCGALGLMAGCSSEPESHLVTAPPPPAPGMAPAPQQVVVVPQQTQVAATAYVPGAPVNSYVVLQAPPAPMPPEAIPERPSPAHVWVAGYWTWQNERYAWMSGHWVVPPYTNAAWVNPHWEREGGAFRFYEGHWNN